LLTSGTSAPLHSTGVNLGFLAGPSRSSITAAMPASSLCAR